MDVPRITPQQALEYELHSSRWAGLVSWGWAQRLLGLWLGRRVRRRWERYAASLDERAQVRAWAERHALYGRPLREARP
jgi:hypothetical protein